MGELTSEQENVIVMLAHLFDVPEEILSIPLPMLTPQEHAERDAAFLRDVDAAYADAVRVVGPRLIADAGLDPERYELAYEDLESPTWAS